jgi:hypothetical protein
MKLCGKYGVIRDAGAVGHRQHLHLTGNEHILESRCSLHAVYMRLVTITLRVLVPNSVTVPVRPPNAYHDDLDYGPYKYGVPTALGLRYFLRHPR